MASLVVLAGAAIQHLNGANDIGRLEQVPARIRLFRAGTHRHRKHMVRWQVELLEGTEHICKAIIYLALRSPFIRSSPTYLRQ